MLQYFVDILTLLVECIGNDWPSGWSYLHKRTLDLLPLWPQHCLLNQKSQMFVIFYVVNSIYVIVLSSLVNFSPFLAFMSICSNCKISIQTSKKTWKGSIIQSLSYICVIKRKGTAEVMSENTDWSELPSCLTKFPNALLGNIHTNLGKL